MSPEYVRPYVKAQKNDDRDAEAIAEAATRPTMRFVPVKSEAQSDVQALHRARERLLAERTALINHLRALLLERGITVPQGRGKLAAELCTFADEDDERLSPRIRQLVEDLRCQWRSLDERIAGFDAEFAALAREDVAARRLMTIPGIGTINATALAAAVGDARTFGRGPARLNWTPRKTHGPERLGMIPSRSGKEDSDGGKPTLPGGSARRAAAEIAVPMFGYKNHVGIDRAHGFVRRFTVAHAAAHDGAQLASVLDPANTANSVWADTAYRSAANIAMLERRGRKPEFQRAKPRGKPMPRHIARGNARRARIRACVEHVFAAQKRRFDLVIRTVGLARAAAKLALANLAYNFTRLAWLQTRTAA